MILNADLSQIEWRVAAFLSQDPTMIAEINSGVDQHATSCTNLMKLPLNKLNRFYAKTFNFRMIYGGTAWGFHKDPHMPKFGIKKWKQVIIDFYLKYPMLKVWQDRNITHVAQGDGTLTIFTGRIFQFKLDMYSGKYNDRQIKNWPIQGVSRGDILPLAGVIIFNATNKIKLRAKPILTVHDSMVYSCPDNEVDRLADLCMKVFNNLPFYIEQYWGVKWNVNLTGEIEIGENYGATKKIRG